MNSVDRFGFREFWNNKIKGQEIEIKVIEEESPLRLEEIQKIRERARERISQKNSFKERGAQ